MTDPSRILGFIWNILQYGGLGLAAVGAIIFIIAKRNNNDDLSTNSIWIVLGGIVAFAVGSFMSGQSLPSL